MPGTGPILGPRTGNPNNAAPSPVMGGVSHSAAVGPDGLGQARKRNVTMAGLDSSPGSVDVDDIEDSELREEKKRQPVKRACNECRQQKVRPALCALLGLAFSSCCCRTSG